MSAPVPQPASDAARPPRPWAALLGGGLVLALLVLFPPFRVVPKGGAAAGAPAGGTAPAVPAPGSTANFSAPVAAEAFWQAQLLPAAAQAPELAPILAAVRRDPTEARRTHARRVGLGETAYLFVRGSGRVVAVERSRVLVAIDGTTLALRTGPVFGNTLRDGCGLLDVNRAPGLAEFNALAAELNRLVETRVQPGLRAVAVGAVLEFAGAAEWPETLPAEGPVLTLVPVRGEVKP